MKKVLFYLLLFICSFSTATFAQSYRRVSEKEALYIAQKQFTGKDVDYYIHKDMNSAVWIIFVDAEPMKGWNTTVSFWAFQSQHVAASMRSYLTLSE